jgi:hypothetical protein
MLADLNVAFNLPWMAFRYFNAAGADPDGEIGEMHDPETPFDSTGTWRNVFSTPVGPQLAQVSRHFAVNSLTCAMYGRPGPSLTQAG